MVPRLKKKKSPEAVKLNFPSSTILKGDTTESTRLVFCSSEVPNPKLWTFMWQYIYVFFPAKAETDSVESAQDLVEPPPTQLYSGPTGTQVWVLAPRPRTGTHLLSHGFLVCKVEKVTPPTNLYEQLVYVEHGTRDMREPASCRREGQMTATVRLWALQVRKWFLHFWTSEKTKKHIFQPVKNYVKLQF